MGDIVHPAQLVVSIVLFLFLFFGIGFLLNMLLKTTWLPGAIIYPLVVLVIVSDVSIINYFLQPIASILGLVARFGELLAVDYIILSSGLIGAILSGIVIQMLRVRGYRMF